MAKRVTALLIALFMAFGLCPASLAGGLGHSVRTPEGYNEHDYQKIHEFLNTEDEEGVSNGEKLYGKLFDPDYAPSWYTVYWLQVEGEKRLSTVYLYDSENPVTLAGELDLSGCTALQNLDCQSTGVSSVRIEGCSSLKYFDCSHNGITNIDFTGCWAMEHFTSVGNPIHVLDMYQTATGIGRLDGGEGYISVSNSDITNYIRADVPFGCLFKGWMNGDGNVVSQQMVFESCVYIDTPIRMTALISWDTIPWNLHDFTMLRRVLSYESGITVKGLGGSTNGELANPYYDPDNDYTMMDHAEWAEVEGQMRLVSFIMDDNEHFFGPIDLSGCTALQTVALCNPGYTELHSYPTDVDLSGCTGLTELYIADLPVTSLDITGCSGLEYISVRNTGIRHLDLTGVSNLAPYDIEAVGAGSVGMEWEYCAHEGGEEDINYIAFTADTLCTGTYVNDTLSHPAWQFTFAGEDMSIEENTIYLPDSPAFITPEMEAEMGVSAADLPMELTAVFTLGSDPIPAGVGMDCIGTGLGSAELAYDREADELHVYVWPAEGVYCTGVDFMGTYYASHPCCNPVVIESFSELVPGGRTEIFLLVVHFGTLPAGLPIEDPASPGPAILAGDVDGSGAVDMSDASMLFSYLNGGSIALSDKSLLCADANKDGAVNVMDITAIFNIIANS